MYLKSLVYRLLHFMAVLALSQTAVFQSQLSGHLLSLKSLKEKKGICVYKDETCVVMKYEDGSYRGIAWNATRNRSGKDLCLNLTIPTTQSASTDAYLFLTQTVDEENCNPLKVWHDLGEPANRQKIRLIF